MRANASQRGFSLVEVATSIGVIAFALVALIGVFPLGLENTRACIADTRATQLVKMISATLEGESFIAADCFSPSSGSLAPLDFRSAGVDTGLSPLPDVTLYASYDVRSLPRLVRAEKAPPEAIYRVELRFRRENFTPLGGGTPPPASRVVGTNVDVKIAGLNEKRSFAESWLYLPNLTPQ